MREHSVLSACQWLLDELKAEASVANHAGAAALAAGQYAAAREAMALGEALSAIRADVAAIMERLEALPLEQPALAPPPKAVKERSAGRGRKTPDAAFRVPILRALVALGGSAPMQSVLEHVHGQIGEQFGAVDLQPLPSDPDSIRWKNTAQWCRLKLKHEGLLRGDSPWGIWEITEAGRKWLEEQEKSAR